MATIALGQMNAGDNAAANLEKIAQLAAQAAAGNADLLVLPEYAMAYPQKGTTVSIGTDFKRAVCNWIAYFGQASSYVYPLWNIGIQRRQQAI